MPTKLCMGTGRQDVGDGWLAWSEQIHPADRASIIAGLTYVLESDQHLWTAEYRFRRADGTYAYVIDHGYVLRDHHGKPYRMIGAKSDITERRQAETMHAIQVAIGLALEESVSFNEAVPKIIRAMCELQGWALGALWLVDAHGKTLRCDALWHQSGLFAEEFARNFTEPWFCNQGRDLPDRCGRPERSCSVRIFSMEKGFPALQAARQAELHGGLAFPIHKGKDILGIMEFLTYDVLRPATSKLERVSELGAMISQFLHRKDLERQLAPGAKDGSIGTHGRRCRPRLQQSPDRHQQLD